MAVENNIISGKDYLLYVKAKADPATAYKMIMCQTDFGINQTKNTTVTPSKCGKHTDNSDPTFEATLAGQLANAQTGGGQDYIDLYEFQDYFVSNVSYDFMLMPKVQTAVSNGLPTIEFSANPSAFNNAWPSEGPATFDITLPMDAAPVIEPFEFVTP